jgi:hypothetical protein
MSNEKKFPAYICIFSQINRQAMIPTHLILTFAKKRQPVSNKKNANIHQQKTLCKQTVEFS